MKKFDFDILINRKGTDSLKWGLYKSNDITPHWVADMDFRSPPAIIDALHQRVEHGIFGYSLPPVELKEVIIKRMGELYGWKVEHDWIVWLPGLVTGLNAACRAIGEKNDDVLTTVPIYPPFLSAPKNSGKNLVTIPMTDNGIYWEIDFDRLEKAISLKTKLFLLCNPHNPVGRVFKKEELTKLAEICDRHGIFICSDEIHCELVLDKDLKHIPTATLDNEIAHRTITLMAPSKTFNIPGIGASFAIISNRKIRKSFKQVIDGIVPHVSFFGFTSMLSAFRDCEDWHIELLEYLRKNRDIIENALKNFPGVSMHHVEATYLSWINTLNSGIKDPASFFEEAGVGLFDGKFFKGPGYVRMNFACPKSMLEESLEKMRLALENRL